MVVPPLAEQQAIAEVLRTVQRAKEATEKVIAATRQLKASLMKHLFTYGLVPFDQADMVPLKETDIGLMPEHWAVKTLGKYASVITKGASPRWQGFEYQPTGLKFLRAQNVGNGRLELTDLMYLDPSFNSKEAKSILMHRDLLITIAGTIGRVAIADKSIDGANINQAVALIRIRDEVLPEFAMSFLLTKNGQIELSRNVKRLAQANLSLQNIRDTRICLAPRNEQEMIATQLAAMDVKLAAEEKRRAALDALFKSLLHHLMTGKLRLPELAE